jgi:hypothetical protein
MRTPTLLPRPQRLAPTGRELKDGAGNTIHKEIDMVRVVKDALLRTIALLDQQPLLLTEDMASFTMGTDAPPGTVSRVRFDLHFAGKK